MSKQRRHQLKSIVRYLLQWASEQSLRRFECAIVHHSCFHSRYTCQRKWSPSACVRFSLLGRIFSLYFSLSSSSSSSSLPFPFLLTIELTLKESQVQDVFLREFHQREYSLRGNGAALRTDRLTSSPRIPYWKEWSRFLNKQSHASIRVKGKKKNERRGSKDLFGYFFRRKGSRLRIALTRSLLPLRQRSATPHLTNLHASHFCDPIAESHSKEGKPRRIPWGRTIYLFIYFFFAYWADESDFLCGKLHQTTNCRLITHSY